MCGFSIKKSRIVYAILTIGLSIIFTVLTYLSQPRISNFSVWHNIASEKYLAHAMGSIDDIAYTNSEEAFIANYQKGFRIFEVDFLYTADNEIVLRHYWKDELQEGIDEEHIPTREKFLNTPILGQLQPVDLIGLFELMKKYPDIYIVTDTKDNPVNLMTDIFKKANELNCLELMNRFIIQIYYEDEIKPIKNIYPFGGYIFTTCKRHFYETREDFEHLAALCAYNGIDTITISRKCWDDNYKDLIDKYNVLVYAFTVNDEELEQTLYSQGCHGIYTDEIVPRTH